jgi:hypothetical protein
MRDNTVSNSTEVQRLAAQSQANQQLFGQREFRTKSKPSPSLLQNRVNLYGRPQRSVSPLIINRSRLQESSSHGWNPTEPDYPDLEYQSPPSSPVRAPTPLWTPPPLSSPIRAPTPVWIPLTYGSDEENDDPNDCKSSKALK